MKHLKGFKIFESVDISQIEEDIREIFDSEVEDPNFVLGDSTQLLHPTAQFGGPIPKFDIDLTIKKRSHSELDTIVGVENMDRNFDIVELEDFILRVLDYSDFNSLGIRLYPLGAFTFKDITKENLGELKDQPINGLSINK